METTTSILAIESAEKLYNAIQNAFPQAASDFESKWAAAHVLCQPQMTSASIDTLVGIDEFKAIERLGPKIIPFVVYKLAKDAEQNSFGVFYLDNALEKDPEYRVNPDEHQVSQEVLRRDSNQIVELNHQRNKIFDERAKAWKEHCQRNHLQSSTAIFTCCDEYEDLVEMGPSIIAPIMVEYKHHWGDCWYELLHEIIHGRKTGARVYQKGAFFDEWCRFFNEKEHDQAYKYIHTPMDIYVSGGECLSEQP